MRQTNDHEGTWQLVTAIVIASVLALLVWNLAIRDVGAAPVDRTCRLYPVTLRHVSCFLGRCSAWEDIHFGGTAPLLVHVTGWNMKAGQIKIVRVCR
jgi:hypothetical protein